MSLNKRLLHRFDYCLNCEASLNENDYFCANCGQKRTTGRISFRQLILQFFEDTFSWDARLFRSIRGLFSPGKLTEEFFKGKQVPYWQPLRLFLFMAALQMFVVNTRMDSLNQTIQKSNDGIKQSVYEYLFLQKIDSLKTSVVQDFNNEKMATAVIDSMVVAYIHPEKFRKTKIKKRELEVRLDSLRKSIMAEMLSDGEKIDSAEIEAEVQDFTNKLVKATDKQNIFSGSLSSDFIEIPFVSVKEALIPSIQLDSNGNLKNAGWHITTKPQKENIAINFDEKETDSKGHKKGNLMIHKTDFIQLSADSIIQKYHVEGFINQVIAKQTIKGMKDGKSGVDFFLSRLSWMIIIMMPIFALFLELMNRPYYYVEHVIFSFHCHAFMFFLISLVFFVNHNLLPENFKALQGTMSGILSLYLLFYFYKAMRRVYKQGRIKTLLKYSFLLFSYFFTMTLALVFTIIVSFFFF